MNLGFKRDYLNKINLFSIILISFYFILTVGYKANTSHILTYNILKVVSNLGFPLFLMTFGVYILNKKSNWFFKVKDSYKQLLPSFIFWNLILVIFIIFYEGLNFSEIYISFRKINWFVLVFLSNILVVPILSEFINLEKADGIKYILILFFISSILWALSIQFNFSLYYIDLVFFAQPFCFMVLGYFLDNLEFNIPPKKLFIIYLLILILTLSLRCLLLVSGVNKWDTYLMPSFKSTMSICFDPFSIIEASSIFLIFKSLNGFLNNNSIINFYSMKSFSILLIFGIFHYILLNNILHMNWFVFALIFTCGFIILVGILLFILDKIYYGLLTNNLL